MDDNEYILLSNDSVFEDAPLHRIDYSNLVFSDDELKKLIANFNSRELQIFSLRFGLNKDKKLSLDEVAEIFNVTPNRILNIESRILKKINQLKNK